MKDATTTLTLTETWRNQWPNETPQRIGALGDDLLRSEQLAAVQVEAIVGAGVCDRRKAERLASTGTITRHALLGETALALRWLRGGGLGDNVAEGRFTNDAMDLDYVVPATFCTEFVTNDAGARDLYEAIVRCGEIVRPAAAA